MLLNNLAIISYFAQCLMKYLTAMRHQIYDNRKRNGWDC